MASFQAGQKRKKGSSRKYKVCKPLFPPEDYERESSYSWYKDLDGPKANFVKVENFKKAPLQNIFHHLKPGLKVEVPNVDYFHAAKAIGGVYWVAWVQKIAGYKALIRYEGAPDDSNDMWVNLCSADVHPVGWCASEGKPLVPPKCLQDKNEDWKNYLVKRLTGARTFPPDWPEKVKKALTDNPFEVGQRLEIVDRKMPGRVRAGIIVKVIGRRIQVEYNLEDQRKRSRKHADDDEEDENELDPEFWCNCYSPLIFPVGWAARTGYSLYASDDYIEHTNNIAERDPNGEGVGGAKRRDEEDLYGYDANDTRPGQFQLYPSPDHLILSKHYKGNGKSGGQEGDAADGVQSGLEAARNELCQWAEGMKLEVLDILDMNYIHVATVTKVLKNGTKSPEWLQIQYDGGEDDIFPFHKESAYLFPIGFCESHNIELQVPKQCEGSFRWPEYLQQTQSVGAPTILFDEDQYDSASKFEIGGKIEIVDNMDPKLVTPGTILEYKGSRLLKLRFDGWQEDYDQYADFRSCDIFPCGYTEMIGYKLEHPKESEDSKKNDGDESTGKRLS